MENLRTEILMIVNEYLLLDVISGEVTSNKELVNKMVDKLVSQLEPGGLVREDYRKKLILSLASNPEIIYSYETTAKAISLYADAIIKEMEKEND